MPRFTISKPNSPLPYIVGLDQRENGEVSLTLEDPNNSDIWYVARLTIDGRLMLNSDFAVEGIQTDDAGHILTFKEGDPEEDC